MARSTTPKPNPADINHGTAHSYSRLKCKCPVCREGNARRQKVYRRNRNRQNPAYNLEYHVLRRYGLTPEAYQTMLAGQGGVCAICGEEPQLRHGKRRFHVDHDRQCCPATRSCGKCIRGLLCGRCNSGLGFFKDEVDRVAAALEYLKKAA